jgi:transcriptional regulator with XRE-family HTH domain
MSKALKAAPSVFSPYALSRYRQEARFSQRDLAERVGVSENTVGHYERGQTVPPPDRIEALAVALGRAPEALLRVPIEGMKFQLVAARLGYSPIDYIDARRDGQVARPDGAEGGWSFRLIAPALSKVVGFYVSYESVRDWHRRAHGLDGGEDG